MGFLSLNVDVDLIVVTFFYNEISLETCRFNANLTIKKNSN